MDPTLTAPFFQLSISLVGHETSFHQFRNEPLPETWHDGLFLASRRALGGRGRSFPEVTTSTFSGNPRNF